MGYLREKRLKSGLKQREVAELCNVQIRVYQKWEQFDRVPRTRDAVNVASVLKLCVEDLDNERD